MMMVGFSFQNVSIFGLENVARTSLRWSATKTLQRFNLEHNNKVLLIEEGEAKSTFALYKISSKKEF